MEAGRVASSRAARDTCPTSGTIGGGLVTISGWNIRRALSPTETDEELSPTETDEAPATCLTSKALGRELDTKGAAAGRCIQRSLHLSSMCGVAFRRIPTVTPKEGPIVKRVPRGRTRLPVFVPLFVLYEFEHLQHVLTIDYSLLLTRFSFLEGNLYLILALSEALPHLLKSILLRLQGSLCLLCTQLHLLEILPGL